MISFLGEAILLGACAAGFVLARRRRQLALATGSALFAVGLLVAFVNLPGFRWSLYGILLCVLAVVFLLGVGLERAGADRMLTRRIVIAGLVVASVLVVLSTSSDNYVECRRFDSTGSHGRSCELLAHGWPEPFIADVSEAKPNLLGLPGDTILAGDLIFDWVVFFYFGLIVLLLGKRYLLIDPSGALVRASEDSGCTGESSDPPRGES